MSDTDAAPRFVDSNVWLYALIEGQDEQKSNIARALIKEQEPVVSSQVVNEVCVNLLRKRVFTEREVRELVAAFYHRYPVLLLQLETLSIASRLREAYSFSFWDSIIVAAALESDVSMLYSEDMHDGLEVEGRLTIVNPFTG